MMTVMPSEVQNTALIARLRQFGVIATGSNRLSDADLLLIDQAQKHCIYVSLSKTESY